MTGTFICQIDETQLGDEGEDGDSPMSLPLSLRAKRPKTKSIEYGPVPKYIIEAIRKQLRFLVEQQDLDAHLNTITMFARQADDMLSVIKPAKAVMRDEHAITLPGVDDTPGNAETYGATIMRTLMAQLTAHQNSALQSPEMLVSAITAARRDGMTDVAAELEKKLLGKSLDGKRPVAGVFPSADSYLAGAATEVVSADAKRKSARKKSAKGGRRAEDRPTAGGGPMGPTGVNSVRTAGGPTHQNGAAT